MNPILVTENTGIQTANSSEQISLCSNIMRQLRPHLEDKQRFVEQVQRQIQERYLLAYLQDGGEVRFLAGFRFLEFLAWGKVLYIDDLISDSAARRNGYGGVVSNG